MPRQKPRRPAKPNGRLTRPQCRARGRPKRPSWSSAVPAQHLRPPLHPRMRRKHKRPRRPALVPQDGRGREQLLRQVRVNSPRKPRRGRTAPVKRLFGPTRTQRFIIFPARVLTGTRKRAPICARRTPPPPDSAPRRTRSGRVAKARSGGTGAPAAAPLLAHFALCNEGSQPYKSDPEESRSRWGDRTSNPGGAVGRSQVGSTPILLRHHFIYGDPTGLRPAATSVMASCGWMNASSSRKCQRRYPGSFLKNRKMPDTGRSGSGMPLAVRDNSTRSSREVAALPARKA